MLSRHLEGAFVLKGDCCHRKGLYNDVEASPLQFLTILAIFNRQIDSCTLLLDNVELVLELDADEGVRDLESLVHLRREDLLCLTQRGAIVRVSVWQETGVNKVLEHVLLRINGKIDVDLFLSVVAVKKNHFATQGRFEALNCIFLISFFLLSVNVFIVIISVIVLLIAVGGRENRWQNSLLEILTEDKGTCSPLLSHLSLP